MGKRKVFLVLALVILGVLAIANAIGLVILYNGFSALAADRDGMYIPVGSQTYVKIDDVAYIRYDMVSLDTEGIENGSIKLYSADDLRKLMDEAVERRDAKEAENSTTG